jgi:branched-chain amino acid transport system permease protein
MIALYVIVVQGFNVSFGLAKLFNLGHVASYAIGAYCTALLAVDYGFGITLCIPVSIAGGALLSYGISLLSRRIVHDYFAIGTIAFAYIVQAVLINWRDVTHGVLGIPGIPRPVIGGVSLDELDDFLWFITKVAFAVLVVLWFFWRGGIARALRAQGEQEHAAQALGVHSGELRTIALLISGGCAGLGGALFSYYFRYIDPSSFSLTEMIFVLTIAIVGRPGSFWGGIAATCFLVLLPEPLRFIEIDSSILGPARQLLYAVVLFTVVAMRRNEIAPRERNI